MPYRLAAIDLDGTLIGSDGKVSEANAGALQHLASRGVVVAAATARPYFAAMRPFEAANVGAAAIACAGADVRLQDGTVVDQAAMAHDLGAFIAGLCDWAGWPATLTTRERTYRLAELQMVCKIKVIPLVQRRDGTRQMVRRPLIVRIQKRDVPGADNYRIKPCVAC